jgi:hypothetical protein
VLMGKLPMRKSSGNMAQKSEVTSQKQVAYL